jgi:hypothetical protein
MRKLEDFQRGGEGRVIAGMIPAGAVSSTFTSSNVEDVNAVLTSNYTNMRSVPAKAGTVSYAGGSLGNR